MTKSDPRSRAEELLEATPPAAVELACLVSLAVRVEPELLRAVRFAAAPQLDVAAEADLWFSRLIASRGPDAISLRPDVSELLRYRLSVRPDRRSAELAWAVIERVHATAAPALVLEERIARLTVLKPLGWEDRVQQELDRALVTLARRPGPSVARWALRAFPRLPSDVQGWPAALQLKEAASGLSLVHKGRRQAGRVVPDLDELARARASRILRVRRAGRNVWLGALSSDRVVAVPVPDTDPQLVELRWHVDGRSRSEQVPVRAGAVERRDVGTGVVHLRSLGGAVYELPPPSRPRVIVMPSNEDRLSGQLAQRLIAQERASITYVPYPSSPTDWHEADGYVVLLTNGKASAPALLEARRGWHGQPVLPVLLGGQAHDLPFGPAEMQALDLRSLAQAWPDSEAEVVRQLLTRAESAFSGADQPDTIMLVYAHRDSEWAQRLKTLLAPLVRNRRLDLRLWDDNDIQVGQDWQSTINDAIARAKLAVLLISADFLASAFIMKVELSSLQARNVRLVPILVHDCLWEDEPVLAQVQWAHDLRRDGPLDLDHDRPEVRDRRLTEICRKLLELVERESHPSEAPRTVQRILAHTDRVRALTTVSLPERGIVLASGSADGAIRLWDPLTGQPVGELTGHTRAVSALVEVPLPDGRLVLASGSDDQTLRLWDPTTNRPLGHPLSGHTDSVSAVAAVSLPDGRTVLATGSWDATVRLWDLTTGRPLGDPLTGHANRVAAVAAVPLPDGRTLLATGSYDHTVRRWDPTTGSEVGAPLPGHTAAVTAVTAVPMPNKQALLASGSADTTVRLWDPASGLVIGDPLHGHNAIVTAITTVPLADGRTLLATGSEDGTLWLWDPAISHGPAS